MDVDHSGVPRLTKDAIITWLGGNSPTDFTSPALLLQFMTDARPINATTTPSSNAVQVVVSDGRYYVPAVLPRALSASIPGSLLRQVVKVNRAAWVPIRSGLRYKKYAASRVCSYRSTDVHDRPRLPVILQCDVLGNIDLAPASPDQGGPQRVPPELVDLPEQWEPDCANPAAPSEFPTDTAQIVFLDGPVDVDAATKAGFSETSDQGKTSNATATCSTADCPIDSRPLPPDLPKSSPALPSSITIDALPAYASTGSIAKVMHVRIARKSQLVAASTGRGAQTFDADM
ncbi:hypothetical protein GGG16DRAFT_105117, partial [Schizophyllum commune]